MGNKTNGQQREVKVPLRKLPKQEQQTEPTLIDPPAGLTGGALDEFNRLIPILGEDIHKTDINLVAAFCIEICRYWECQKILERDGMVLVTHSGYSQQRPEITISRQSLQNAISLASQIGLSAKSKKQLMMKGSPKTRRNPATGSQFADR